MGKVITGAGLQEFIETGKHETIANSKPSAEKPADSPKGAVPDKAAGAAEASKPQAKEEPKETKAEEGLDPEDQDLSEVIRKKIGKKHRAMKEAQEAQADAESFAKNQYDRARLAEERAAALERELQESRKAPEAKTPELVKPDIKDFTDDKGQIRWTEYTDKTAEYAAAKAVEDERKRSAKEREAAELARFQAQIKERFDKAKIKYPDFEELSAARRAAGTDQVPMGIVKLIERSSHGADLAYYLLKNPEEAKRLRDIQAEDDGHPERAIAEAGQLMKQFQEPPKTAEVADLKVPERSGAPPPITPVSGTGSGTVNVDPAKMSFKELRDYERAKLKRH